MRVSRTHQDIRRVTHTGGVNEGRLTSLTPERQFCSTSYILYKEVNLSPHSDSTIPVVLRKSKSFVRAKEMRK